MLKTDAVEMRMLFLSRFTPNVPQNAFPSLRYLGFADVLRANQARQYHAGRRRAVTTLLHAG